MLTHVKMALAGSAMLACALPVSAAAQTYYDTGYGYAPAYDYSYTYADPYAWGPAPAPTPFWPVNAAAGIVGAAADAVAAPFVGWRDGYYVDQRVDPVRDSYGYTYGYNYGYAPAYGDVPVEGYATVPAERYAYGQQRYWDGWNRGYVATYRGKAPMKHHATHVSAKLKKSKTQHHMAAR